MVRCSFKNNIEHTPWCLDALAAPQFAYFVRQNRIMHVRAAKGEQGAKVNGRNN